MIARRLLSLLFIAVMLAASSPQVLAQRRLPAPRAAARAEGRIVLVSLDALGYHLWRNDPATQELRALRRIAARGTMARGMIQAFPSITPASHAALWTGAYGDVSGIITTSNPLLPRSQHTAFKRSSGFNADLLQAEPIWAAAARQGVRVLAHQATQNYPFVPQTTAPGASVPPVLVSGYGPATLVETKVIRPADVTIEEADGWNPALPRSMLPIKAFHWTINNVTFHGALVAEARAGRRYNALYVAVDRRGARVRVALAPTESAWPRGRAHARFFSAPLPLTVGERSIPTVAYFRLFELAPDGSDFLLYQPAIHEVAVYDGSRDTRPVVEAMLREAGGFIGNGPSRLYEAGHFGAQLHAGGDGTAERRYLEGMELVLRQLNRLTSFYARRYPARLHIDYSPYPDEMDHAWYGMARPDVTGVDQGVARRIAEYRRWGYALVDERVALLDSLAGPRGHIIFVSDHGMSPIAKEVRVNIALRQAGLLAVTETEGRTEIAQARTRAVHLRLSILVNTDDWLNGIVPLAERRAVVDAAERALRAVRDPETNQPVFTAFFRPEQFGERFGIGGPAGGDLYFELAPGYYVSDRLTGNTIERVRVPYGAHGFLPTRPEMLASFIARGPRLPNGRQIETIRAIDVAPLVADLLGISPPAQSRGRSPLELRQRATQR